MPLSLVHWVDSSLSLDGLPGRFQRHGRYLYLRADRGDGIVADGRVVDGLQLVRTDGDHATRLTVGDLSFEGVSDHGSVGIRMLPLGA